MGWFTEPFPLLFRPFFRLYTTAHPSLSMFQQKRYIQRLNWISYKLMLCAGTVIVLLSLIRPSLLFILLLGV